MITVFRLRRAPILFACLAVVVPGSAVHASAVGGRVCAGTLTWTFSPPLDSTFRVGTVTENFAAVCGFGQVFAFPQQPWVGETATVFGITFTGSGVYSGTCQSAFVGIGTSEHTLLASSIAIGASITVPLQWNLQMGVLVPDVPCNASSATGPAIGSLGGGAV